MRRIGHATCEPPPPPRSLLVTLFACVLFAGGDFPWVGTRALAQVPFFQGIEQASPPGPRTETVDERIYQHVLHVAPPAAGATVGDGGRDNPFATLAQALDAAADARADNRYAVLVSAGTYEAADLRMKPFVDLFGGFDDAWNRDISKRRAVLDARRAGPVVHGADDARLDGFVLINGQNTGPGGAIVCEHVSPVISNNVIRDNATVAPKGFRRDILHQRGTDGGAVALLVGSHAAVRNNLICHNKTGIGSGGGISVWNRSNPRISDNVICGNETGLAGREGKQGSRSSNGGAIAVSMECAPEITGNVIAMNRVGDNSDGGGIYLEYDADAHVRGNWIIGNEGRDDGGGMYVMKNSEPVVEYNVFAGNRTPGGGSGAIRLSKEGRLRAMNNLFISNFNYALDAVDSWMVLKNNTFIEGADRAIMFHNQKPHFAPSEISGNLFVGTPTPVLSRPGPVAPILANNFVQATADETGEASGGMMFVDDSHRGSVVAARYDPASCSTTLEVSEAKLPTAELSGRVIKLGERWSVIRSSDPKTLTVWGNVEGPIDSFLIAGTYRPAEGSPALGFGAHVARPTE